MKGGCFGKILSFILGVVVGIVLLAGSLAGIIYYAIAGVTINDVESLADIKIDVIDEKAEIREKTILDVVEMVQSGKFANMTVEGVKKTLGVDIVGLIEKTLDITITEESKAELNAVPVLKIFQDDNLKKVLNSVTVRNIFEKVGIDMSAGLASLPLLQEHIDEPLIDGLNGVLTTIDMDTLSIAELEYLLGLSFGDSGLFGVLATYKLGDIFNAINNIRFEQVFPNFDRDLYYDTTEGLYEKGSLTAFGNSSYKSLIEEGYFNVLAEGDARDSAVTYYTLNQEEGTIKVDNKEGRLYLKADKTLPDFRERYSAEIKNNAIDYSTLKSDRNGAFYLDATGVLSINRANADGTQSNFGKYYYPYTKSTSGTYYLMYAGIESIVPDTSPTKYIITMVPRKFVDKDSASYFVLAPDMYELNSDKELVENASGNWALGHIGTTTNFLKALSDSTLNTMDKAVGDLTLGDVIVIDDSSAKILQSLKDVSINNLGSTISTLTIADMVDIDSSSPLILQALKDSTLTSLATDLNDLKLSDVIDTFSSHIILQKLSGYKITELSDHIVDAVNDCTLEDILPDITAGSFLYEIKDTKISDLDSAVTTTIQNATIGELNKWGNLGLTDVQLNKTVGGTPIKDMNIATFLKYAISALPST